MDDDAVTRGATIRILQRGSTGSIPLGTPTTLARKRTRARKNVPSGTVMEQIDGKSKPSILLIEY